MSGPENDRLECWVQIADYLKCTVRTARRWEKTRGLPVHRLPGEHSAVFAYRSEIDTWLAEASCQPALDESGHSTARSLASEASNSSHSVFRRVAGPMVAFVTISMVVLIWIHRGAASSIVDIEGPPQIISVSVIAAQKDQKITINGSGFGLYTPYQNADIPFIAIRDKTAQWSAGRIIPQNWDEVTLNVQSWQDKQIIVSGFSGTYGTGEWKLAAGDEIEVAVWNPQSGHGAATYRLTVSPQPTH